MTERLPLRGPQLAPVTTSGRHWLTAGLGAALAGVIAPVAATALGAGDAVAAAVGIAAAGAVTGAAERHATHAGWVRTARAALGGAVIGLVVHGGVRVARHAATTEIRRLWGPDALDALGVVVVLALGVAVGVAAVRQLRRPPLD